MAIPLTFSITRSRITTNTKSYLGFLAIMTVWIGIGIYGKLHNNNYSTVLFESKFNFN